MVDSIWDDIKREYRYGNMVTRIIFVNIAVFLFINIIWVVLRIAENWPDHTPALYITIRNALSLSSDPWFMLTHPWTLITANFLHEGFWHILFNMLMFYWFGRIVGDFIGNHRVLPLYLLGGLMGAIAFFVYAALRYYGTPTEATAWGASAAVMATVVAAAMISPDYIMRVILIGDVKLKYIAAVLILIDIFGMGGTDNTGGHFGHIGGTLMGWLFVWQLRRGNDLSAPINKVINQIESGWKALREGRFRKKGPRVVYRNPSRSANPQEPPPARRPQHKSDNSSHQERLDAILDKIKSQGYDNLSAEEKDFLFNASKR